MHDTIHTNDPFFIALQVVPSLATGGVGVGKTSIGLAINNRLKRRSILFISSQNSAEDIGGFPSPDVSDGVVKMLPPYWFETLREPGGAFVADEVTTSDAHQRAPLLSLFTEGKVGQYFAHKDTLYFGFCNPPELAPNGSPLEPAMANRFFHWNWKMDTQAWLDGVLDPITPLIWSVPEFPLVPSDWREMLGKWATMVGEFLRSHGNLYETVPRDGEMAFASYRTWTMAMKCLAAADAAGQEMFSNNTMVRALVAGCVGENNANQFVQWKKERDLVNIEDLLDGEVTFKHNDNRPDVTLCVAAGVTSVICNKSKFTPDRWDRAAAIIGKIGTECSPEIALKHNARLRQAAIMHGYSPKAAALKPLLALMSTIDELMAKGGA